MPRTLRLLPLICLLLPSAASVPADEPPAATIDFLSDASASGENTLWKVFLEDPHLAASDVWSLDDGVLVCKGTPKGYIYTADDYRDFVLTLQWRWPSGKKPGKGGILIRTTGPNKIWPKCLEAQINAPDAGDFWGLGGYELSGPAERSKTLEHPDLGKLTNVKKAKDAEKPAGQWNDYEIIAKGDVVRLKINGQVVNQASGCELSPGKICLTSEGDEIHFRNIRLTPMDKPSK